MAAKPLVVIVGETASGKSDLALWLAQKFNGEIISADSWSVYKGFDIGTAKPSANEQAKVKHHLIDVVEPKDGFNAVKYKHLANIAIETVHQNNKLPIMVGGTGLYIDSVIYDFNFLPVSSERKKLDKMDLDELLALAAKRKINMDDIDQRNKRRVVRAIEAKGKKPTKQKIRPNTVVIGLKTQKANLRQKITNRVNLMIESGLEEETRELANKLGWYSEPMKGIGYMQWREYFNNEQSLEETKNRIIQATLGLAKRQRTWFKRNKSIHWVTSYEQAKELVDALMNKHLLQ
jgi:tRNA dimethylallyltransferase